MSQQAETTVRPARRRGVTVALWAGQGLLAAAFLLTGGGKLAGTERMVDLFDTIGAGQWFRYVVGALEVAGAIGLLVPRLAGLAALGLSGVMAGAVVTELLIGGTPLPPAVLGVLAALVAWGHLRRPASGQAA
jgi:putative oxidoreductase